MFELNEKQYELKFNTGRVKLIEKALGGESVTHAMLDNDGMMSLTAVTTMFQYGLKEVGADVFVAPKTAGEICEEFMRRDGYVSAVREIQLQMKADMGFLFRQP